MENPVELPTVEAAEVGNHIEEPCYEAVVVEGDLQPAPGGVDSVAPDLPNQEHEILDPAVSAHEVPFVAIVVEPGPSNGGQFEYHTEAQSVPVAFVQLQQQEHEDTPSKTVEMQYYTHRCSYCGKGFADMENLKQHENFHVGIKPYECLQCGKTFTQESNLITHEQRHAGEKPYQCRYCSKVFAISSNLQSHEARHTGQGQFKCIECDKTYFFRYELQKHMMKFHPESKPYKCLYCDKRFSRIASRAAHTVIHTDERPHKCKICKESFKKLTELQNHKAIHPTQAKTHECPDCGKNFVSGTILKFHRQTFHGQNKTPNPPTCNICLKTFKLRSSLWTHKKTHLATNPFVCTEENCDKKFKTKNSLKVHMTVHTGERMFKCDQCPKTFLRKTNLDAHKNIHVQHHERPYTCETCGKGCSFHSELLVHERSHTGERPFVCNVCGQTFSQRGNLSQHEITHFDAKAHKCHHPECTRAYKYVTDLQKHIKMKHDLKDPFMKEEKNEDLFKDFKCVDCGKKFSKVSGYKNHECKAEPKPFACNKCHKRFAKIFQLQNHKRQHTTAHKCEECDVGFVTELLLQQHKLTHIKITCSTCVIVFTVEKNYKQHLKICSLKKQDGAFVCSVCSEAFSGAPNLKMHEAKIHGLSPFRCKVCVEGFQRASQLKQHEEIHLKESTHQCKRCDQPFLTESDLSSHAKQHVKRFSCEKCGENFKLKKDLNKHKCDDDEEDMACTLCEEVFATVAELESHMIEHVEKESFACAQCMKEFLDVPSLRVHEKNEHEGLDPYPCNFCELRFTNRSEHKIHSEIHKTLKCQFCNEFFPTAEDLKAHESDHLVCEHCSTKFPTLDKLNSHVKSCKTKDADDKNKTESGFPCPVCKNLFSQLGNMQTHKRKVHGIEPYQCQSCGDQFSLLSLLKRHLAMEHSAPIQAKATAAKVTFEEASMPTKIIAITKGKMPKSSKPVNNETPSKTRVTPKKVESVTKEIPNKTRATPKKTESVSKETPSKTKAAPKKVESVDKQTPSKTRAAPKQVESVNSESPSKTRATPKQVESFSKVTPSKTRATPKRVESVSKVTPSETRVTPKRVESVNNKSSSQTRATTKKVELVSKLTPSKTKATPKKVEPVAQSKVQLGTKRKIEDSEPAESPRPKRGVTAQGATLGGKSGTENHREIGSKKQGGKIRLPFKCRHCDLKFPSASKKMQHEQCH